MKKVISVKPLKDYMLQLEFDSKEIRLFDVKPYLNSGIFTELKNENYFNDVRTSLDSILPGKTDRILALKHFTSKVWRMPDSMLSLHF